MNPIDYWKECISDAADSCGLTLTKEQLTCIAESVETSHENYDLAYYSPPSQDRYAELEREWKAKFEAAEKRWENYMRNSEEAIKRALDLSRDAHVSIEEHGQVFLHGGRMEQIQ